MFKYDKLWKILIDKGMTKEQLRIAIGSSSATITTMGKGGNISMGVIARICETLGVQPGDILEYIPEKPDVTRSDLS